MVKKTVISIFLAISSVFCHSQDFSILSTSIECFESGNAIWADIDNDNDLDIAVSRPFKVYENNSNTFSEIPGIASGFFQDIIAADFNNDNLIDFAVCGSPSRIYFNEGAHVFTYIELASVTYGAIAAGDLNNNGFDDLIISGVNNGNVILFLYQNLGGTNFAEIDHSILGINKGQIEIFDFNKDQYNDIVISGVDNNGNPANALYLNNRENNFIKRNIDVALNTSYETRISLADFDNDGYMGIAQTNANKNYIINYQADSNFSSLSYFANTIENGRVQAINFDNDEYMDILLSGNYGFSYPIETHFLKQSSPTVFSDSVSNDYSAYAGIVEPTDYDNDGDVDFYLMGVSPGTYDLYYGIFENNQNTLNDSPSIPSNLQGFADGKDIILTWSPSNDDQTPQGSITYNVYIGTAPGTTDIVGPKANLSNGYRSVFDMGNTGNDTAFIISGLAEGIYYWGVQALDNCNNPSAFSYEEAFEIFPSFIPETLSISALSTIQSEIELADIDNDNDLDILYLGSTAFSGGQSVASIFRNESMVFTEENIDIVIQQTITNFVAEDFNNDNFIDIFLFGNVSRLLKNNNGVYDTLLEFGPDQYGILNTWGDFNNDGAKDILIGNNFFYTDITETGNVWLTGEVADLPRHSTNSCFDYNKDGYTDSWIGGGLYENQNPGFSYQAVGPLITEGTAYPADVDGNGTLDVLYTGHTIGDNIKYTDIYLNSGNAFSHHEDDRIRKVSGCGLWGDFNNDGLMDFFLGGESSTQVSELYLQTEDLNFVKLEYTFTPTPHRNQAKIGDIDNDGDLDIVIKSGQQIFIYHNNISYWNSPPAQPFDLKSSQYMYGIKLEWAKAEDDHTPQNSLSYNVMVGSDPDNMRAVSPSALQTGQRSVVSLGNASLNNFFLLDTLETGRYYWTVQAIDGSYKGGEWAPVDSFDITTLNVEFSLSADTICMGDSITFTDNSILLGDDIFLNWHWSFADGNESWEQNTKHAYNFQGEFWVKLTVTTELTQQTDSALVVIKPAPLAEFDAPPVCEDRLTHFEDLSYPNETTVFLYQWDFGDGSSSNIEGNFDRRYYDPGTYTASLTIQATNGCMGHIEKNVVIVPIPNAILQIKEGYSNLPCIGDTAILKTVHEPQYEYFWLHSFDTSSFYIMGGQDADSLVLTDPELVGYFMIRAIDTVAGCSSEAMTEVYFKESPEAPRLLIPDERYVFESEDSTFARMCQGDSISIQPEFIDPTVNIEWYRDGGFIGNSDSIVARFGGRFSLVLQREGCWTESINAVYIDTREPPPVPVIKNLSATKFCMSDSVILTFDTIPSLSYVWIAGGQKLPGLKNDSIIVKLPSIYSLETYTTEGCKSKSSFVPIEVDESPPDFEVVHEGPVSFCSGDSVLLILPNSDEFTYYWKSTNSSGTLNIGNSYYAKKTGEFSAVIENELNCTSKTSNTVQVTVEDFPAQPALSRDNDSIICQGESVTLSSQLTDNSLSWQWYRFDDPIEFDDDDISIKVIKSGLYSLYVETPSGCSNQSQTLFITVNDNPDPTFIDMPDTGLCPNEKMKLEPYPYNEGYVYKWLRNGSTFNGADAETLEGILVPGEYKLIVNNGSCSDTTQKVTVRYKSSLQAPELKVFGPKVWYIGCTNDRAADYRWFYNGGLLEYEKDFICMANQNLGAYSVSITDGSGCWVSSDTVTIPTTDFKQGFDIEPHTTVDIYPNPSNGRFNIEIKSTYNGGISYALYNTMGQLILSSSFKKMTSTATKTFDATDLTKGIYYLKTQVGKSSIIKEIVIE